MDQLSQSFHKQTGIKPMKVNHPSKLVFLASLQSCNDCGLSPSNVEDVSHWI